MALGIRSWSRGRKALLGLVALFFVLQLVPYGRDHSNPPVVREPAWNAPATRSMAVRRCFDCHSNETVWPWYASVAPFSWVIQNHVDEGRSELNFSEWHLPQREAHMAPMKTQTGEMPEAGYLPLHPEAQLTPEEVSQLARGLLETINVDRGGTPEPPAAAQPKADAVAGERDDDGEPADQD